MRKQYVAILAIAFAGAAAYFAGIPSMTLVALLIACEPLWRVTKYIDKSSKDTTP